MTNTNNSRQPEWIAWVSENSDLSLRTSRPHLVQGTLAACGAKEPADVFDWIPGYESTQGYCKRCDKMEGA